MDEAPAARDARPVDPDDQRRESSQGILDSGKPRKTRTGNGTTTPGTTSTVGDKPTCESPTRGTAGAPREDPGRDEPREGPRRRDAEHPPGRIHYGFRTRPECPLVTETPRVGTRRLPGLRASGSGASRLLI